MAKKKKAKKKNKKKKKAKKKKKIEMWHPLFKIGIVYFLLGLFGF